jgi:hypothetical protein
MSIEQNIKEQVIKLNDQKSNVDEIVSNIMELHNEKISLFQKNRLDIANWVKSELSGETRHKLDKRNNAYRDSKVIFLRRILKWINN